MKKAYEILFLGRKILTDAINEEINIQGHTLTGNLQRSQNAEVEVENNITTVKGFIASYGSILDAGTQPARASMKQFPFLVEYFKLRGYDDSQSKAFAAATINKWVKEGMSTFASRRYSKTRERQYFLRIALRKASKKAATEINEGFKFELKNIFQGIRKTETI